MEWIYDNVWLIWRFTSFVNTTKKPSHGLGKASTVVKKNGWTLRTLSGGICDGSCEAFTKTHVWEWEFPGRLRYGDGKFESVDRQKFA